MENQLELISLVASVIMLDLHVVFVVMGSAEIVVRVGMILVVAVLAQALVVRAIYVVS